MKTNHMVSVIAAAVQGGFEFDPTETVEDVWMSAENFLLETESCGINFIHCTLEGHGMSQSYSFVDEDGTGEVMSGEIFTFPKAKASDNVYFKIEDDKITSVAWHDIPDGEGREKYAFVFAREVSVDGKVAYLYDWMA